MVLLTMTSSMVDALEKIQSLETEGKQNDQLFDELQRDRIDIQENEIEDAAEEPKVSQNPLIREATDPEAEPILEDPKIGNPISHGQVVDLLKKMKDQGIEPCRLETLLKGARIYIPSPPAKPEPVSPCPLAN